MKGGISHTRNTFHFIQNLSDRYGMLDMLAFQCISERRGGQKKHMNYFKCAMSVQGL